MTGLLAAEAANVRHGSVELTILVHHFLVLLRLVLRVLTTRLILVVFTAAPPDLATPLALMNPAAPVEVLRFNEVTRTVLANFLSDVELALAGL